MSVNSLDDLFVEGLKEAYYTENQLLDALDELSSGTSDEDISNAFSEHREETEQHVQRLEDVFDQIGESPEEKEDNAVKGLIQDHEEFTSQDPDQKILDRFNVAAGQKSEHYEIALYGNLTPMAQDLGLDDVADTLEETLREEQEALEELSEFGEQFDEQRETTDLA